jgi:effector-binding domain-containing protein
MKLKDFSEVSQLLIEIDKKKSLNRKFINDLNRLLKQLARRVCANVSRNEKPPIGPYQVTPGAPIRAVQGDCLDF